MKYAIGYQLPDELDSIVEIAKDYRDYLEEVYFAWPGEASGRSPLGIDGIYELDKIKRVLLDELKQLDEMGIKLVLLFNSNCYGAEAISISLKKRICSIINEICKEIKIASVTTTSPFIAKTVKEAFPEIEIRASVNMRIGTIKGMEQMSDHFDGFYMQRDYNRDLSRVAKLKNWCTENDKKLYLLANSGCLNFCSSQTYHDNLVGHEAEIIIKENVETKYPSPCWEFMKQPKNWVNFLENSWIRPEDIENYNQWFTVAKLATRMHANPRKVLAAYVRRKFNGNLLDLTEPSYGPLFQNNIIDNTLFPADWFITTTKCNKECHACNYCREVIKKVLVSIN